MRPIRRLLIANRGEIAVRIARGARAAGIVPLGVYSDADAGAMHVDAMDDALCIGPAAASESYLAIERILTAARALRADAVHPGYGFLSERAAFARAVTAAGLVFVGPTADAIDAMGDKTEAKRRARAHGVPVVPGYDGDDASPERLRSEAAAIGVPLLIKASAGGGGRGMRVVEDLATFDEALASARREALAAFGDDRVLLERYLTRPRHIEFQILADTHGAIVYAGERECSIQRRHQKVLEEAPSVALDAALRARMGDAAVRIARSVGYTNAGTVEFMLDERGDFYFLEMNARLQVEHPVTELVHGIDLVRLQLAIANGEPLPVAQEALASRGWAIEARLNAEDPATGYLPATGTISRFDVDERLVRVDTGVRAGSEVSIHYDSMLAKLIAYGASRAEAIERLTAALASARIEGVATNVPLLLRVLRDPEFRAGAATTAFLGERPQFLAPCERIAPDGALLLACAALLANPRAWRVASVGIPLRLRCGTRAVAVAASRMADGAGWSLAGDLAFTGRFEVAGERVAALAEEAPRIAGRARVAGDTVEVTFEGERYAVDLAPAPSLAAARAHDARGVGAIVSPMPGKIVSVAVREGDTVAERDVLIVLEAMKMEHRIAATRDGVVKRIAVAPGALVAGGATLVELES